MSVIEEIFRMSKVGCSDKKLLDYIYANYDEIEFELSGNESKEPKKRYYDLCINLQLGNDNRLPKIDFSLYEMWFM